MHYQFVEHAFATSELLQVGARVKQPVRPLVWNANNGLGESPSRQRKQSSRARTRISIADGEGLSNHQPAHEYQNHLQEAVTLLDIEPHMDSDDQAQTIDTHTTRQTKVQEQTHQTSTIARTIRPAVGAPHSNTLHLASKDVVDNIFDTQINIVWPIVPGPYDPHSRLSLLCSNELLFYVYATASAVHKDVVQGAHYWTAKAEILSHACSAVGLLNRLLNHLTDASIEVAILSILLLHVSPLDWYSGSVNSSRCLFSAYPNLVSHIDVWGKVLVEGGRLAAGVRAMKALVERRGGLDKLHFKGLATQVAIGDLLVASRLCSVPGFSCHWHKKNPTPDLELTSNFRSLGLPPNLLATLLRLRQTDQFIARRIAQPGLTHNDHSEIMYRRCCIQHEVLSVPSYEQLPQDERTGSSGDVYEACRLTALLYSTFVIFGMPPDTSWHLVPLRQLRQVLEKGELLSTNPFDDLLIWICTVAGMAAFYTDQRKFYQTMLLHALEKSQVWDWDSFREVLIGFCWSDNACSAGTDILWNAVKLASSEDRKYE